jgi:ketosteroid isomerase-like protein
MSDATVHARGRAAGSDRAQLEMGATPAAVGGGAPPATVVQAYAAAKSSGDIEGALAVCHPEAVVETIAFQAIARGAAETRAQFTGFLQAFPDYDVELDVLRTADDMVFSSGTIRATMMGPLAGIEPTGRRYALPFACHWTVREGLIVHEAFFYDFNQMCEQLGLNVNEAARRFRTWRSGAMGRHEDGPAIA